MKIEAYVTTRYARAIVASVGDVDVDNDYMR